MLQVNLEHAIRITSRIAISLVILLGSFFIWTILKIEASGQVDAPSFFLLIASGLLLDWMNRYRSLLLAASGLVTHSSEVVEVQRWRPFGRTSADQWLARLHDLVLSVSGDSTTITPLAPAGTRGAASTAGKR